MAVRLLVCLENQQRRGAALKLRMTTTPSAKCTAVCDIDGLDSTSPQTHIVIVIEPASQHNGITLERTLS